MNKNENEKAQNDAPASVLTLNTPSPLIPMVADPAPSAPISPVSSEITPDASDAPIRLHQGDGPYGELMRLVPPEKTAEASGLLLKLFTEARTEGAPIDPSKARLTIERGKKYRRSNREPKT